MSGSGSKHLLMPLGHGLAPSAMAQCGLQGEMRILTSFCPAAFSLLLHLHVSLPPLSTTTVNVSSLGSKNNLLEEDNHSQAALPCGGSG